MGADGQGLPGQLVALGGGLGDGLAVDGGQIAASKAAQDSAPVGLRGQPFAGAQRDVGAGGEAFHTAVAAADARRAIRLDLDVAKLAGHAFVAAPGQAVENPPAADAGADGDIQQAVAALAGAVAVLAQRGDVSVVVYPGGRAKLLFQALAQWQVLPAGHVVREAHGAGGVFHRAAKAHAYGGRALAGQQFVPQGQHGGEVVARISAGRRDHLPPRPPLTFAAAGEAGGVLGAAKVKGQDQVSHFRTTL